MPADLAVMILAPKGDDRALLRALSCTARCFREGDVATRLCSASNAEELYAVFVGDVWNGADIAEMDIRSSGT